MAIEFVELTPRVSYVNAPTAMGIVRNGTRVALVDTGLDENLVRKVLQDLQKEGLSVEAVVNTHAHADHFGGNAFVKQRTNACIHAPANEAPFHENPGLEPWTLWGAAPPRAMQTKFLQAQASPVDERLQAGQAREIIGLEWRFHALPGHSVDQMAVEVDGACFLGDALLPQRILDKYGVAFAVDPGAQRQSIERIPDIRADVFQCYHGGRVEDVRALVDGNRRAVDATREQLLAILEKPATAEEVFREVARQQQWKLSVEQYALNFATVRGYLAWLEREGALACAVDDARLVWAHR